MSSELQPQMLTRVVEMRGNGLKQKDIARSLGISQGCVSKVLARIEIYGNPKQKHRSGRPRSSTERADRHLLQLCRNGRAKSTNVLCREWQQLVNVRVCRKTVNNQLISAGYRSRVPKWKPKLTQRHREAHLRWAEQHRRLQPGHW